MYDKLVAKVNNIDTSGFALKAKYTADKSDLQNKILDISGRFKKTDWNTKISELENKPPSISGLVTTSALTAVGNKIPEFSSLVKKKRNYDIKNSEIETKFTDHNHDKFITTPKFNF